MCIRDRDGVKYTELKEHLAKNGENIKVQLRVRKYKPQPVRRVEISKPDGGVRNLGVPTLTDRFVQQAIAQVLTPIYEEQFHDHSYGFKMCIRDRHYSTVNFHLKIHLYFSM